jgi:dolichol-phosphate mannosyltransferase
MTSPCICDTQSLVLIVPSRELDHWCIRSNEVRKFNIQVPYIRQKMLYSIILPTYNERENLPIIFYLIHKCLTEVKLDFEVVIVDDNSPDGTLAVAEAIQKSYGKNYVSIVSRAGKLGLGTAYVAGLKVAKGERIILMDADLSHHPKFIPQMVQVMEAQKVDIVTGTRYLSGGGVAGWDLKRKLVSKGANILADFLLNPGVSDLTGSFRLYERRALENVLPKVTCKGYAFQMEIVVLAKKAGFTISEVPITFVDRVYGESKLGGKEILLYAKGLVTLFLTT